MTSIQARVLAVALRTLYKPGWYSKLDGDSLPRDRGGGIDDAIRRTRGRFRVTPVEADGVPCAWIEPVKPAAEPVIMYLHGGGYTSGKLSYFVDLLGHLALRDGLRSLYVDYRIAPRHVFPAALDDALTVYRSLHLSGVPAGNIIVAGDSAGGGLALSTMLAARDAGLPLPAGAALISPWTDLAATGESLVSRARVEPMLNPSKVKPSAKIYLGAADPTTPLASPLFADLRGLPPLFIQVGDAEILLDDSRRLADRAARLGVNVSLTVWPGLFHDFPIFPSLLPEARQAVKAIARFVYAQTGATESEGRP